MEAGGLIGERHQFIRENQFADAGADIVNRIEDVSQVGNRGNAGIPPGIHFICESRVENRKTIRFIRYARRFGRIYITIICAVC